MFWLGQSSVEDLITCVVFYFQQSQNKLYFDFTLSRYFNVPAAQKESVFSCLVWAPPTGEVT